MERMLLPLHFRSKASFCYAFRDGERPLRWCHSTLFLPSRRCKSRKSGGNRRSSANGLYRGRTTNAKAGQQIVFMRAAEYGDSAIASQPYTKIQPIRHGGTPPIWVRNTAILVEPVSCRNQDRDLTAEGNGVISVATATGKPLRRCTVVAKVIHFSGYDWTVRTASDRGGSRTLTIPRMPGPTKRFLHLRMEEHNGNGLVRVSLTRSLAMVLYIRSSGY